MDNIELLNFNNSFIDDVLNIEKTSLFSNWTKQMFLDVCSNKNNVFKIIKFNNKIVGYIVYSVVLEDAEILNIVVDVNYRGKEFGKKLLEYCIVDVTNKKCNNIFLEVASKNVVAISLYKKYGFMQYNIRKKYYKDDDALLLKKTI